MLEGNSSQFYRGWPHRNRMEQGKRYLSVTEVAAYLGLSRWTIYDLVDKRRIPFIKLSRKALRFDRLRVDSFMAKHETKALSEYVAKGS